jgi:hypothetical protein
MKIYRLINKFDGEPIVAGVRIESIDTPENFGSEYSLTESEKQPRKFINIPIQTDFKNNGYSDLINEISLKEKENNINTVIDRETIKYNLAEINSNTLTNLNIKFNFYNQTTNTYGNDWVEAGFTNTEINEKRNSLTKSFFKMDFYDSDDQNKKNYLFSEFLNVGTNNSPNFSFNRIYWLKNDPRFIDGDSYRPLYFDVSFFNAKDGTIRKFINKEITTPATSPTFSSYKNNKQWRFAEFRIVNPNTINTISKNRVFYVQQPRNNNTNTEIIFSEIRF